MALGGTVNCVSALFDVPSAFEQFQVKKSTPVKSE
jgi:hypothetical protein